MKRWSILALAVLLAAALTGCANDREANRLLEEREALQSENARLEEALSALRTENADLTAENESLRSGASGDSSCSLCTGEENPIDSFFSAAWETVGDTTVEMTALADMEADAWQAEVSHLSGQLKEQLVLAEDRDVVDGYLKAMEDQIDRMYTMALFSCADLTVPQSERLATAGTIRGVLWGSGRTKLCRDTFYQLADHRPGWDEEYVFAFNASAAAAQLQKTLG